MGIYSYIGENNTQITFDTDLAMSINDFVGKNNDNMDINGEFAAKGSINLDFVILFYHIHILI